MSTIILKEKIREDILVAITMALKGKRPVIQEVELLVMNIETIIAQELNTQRKKIEREAQEAVVKITEKALVAQRENMIEEIQIKVAKVVRNYNFTSFGSCKYCPADFTNGNPDPNHNKNCPMGKLEEVLEIIKNFPAYLK